MSKQNIILPMFTKLPFRILLLFAITILFGFQASASDQRLNGFWVRTETEVPSKRWTLSANGTGIHESDFGPPYPGFVLTTYFTWTTNAANNTFIYTVNRQSATGNGPYNYDEPVSPPKTYSAPYTLTGTTNKIWAYETYTYAQADSVTEENTVGPGTTDTTFNKTGFVSFDNLGVAEGYPEAVAGAIQAEDGKTLVVSNHRDASGVYRAFLSRYNIGGTLDKTFNQTGTSVTEFGSQVGEAKAMAVDPRNGKIIVVGTSYDTNSYPSIDLTISRHTSTGTHDTTFNATGRVLTDISEMGFQVYGLAIQPSDGKIVVVGSAETNQGQSVVILLRYLTNGQLDTTFNGNGRANGVSGTARCVAIQPGDGKIVVGGGSYGLGHTLWRFNTNGTLDTTFNPGGQEPGKFVSGSYRYDSRDSLPDCLCLGIRPSDGKIFSGGYIYFGNGRQFLILCSNNPDGTPDQTFNGTGRVVESVSTGIANGIGGQFTYHDGSANHLVIQPDGKIIVSGKAVIGNTPDATRKTAVLRYNQNGTLDPTFAGTGKAFIEVGPYSPIPNGLLVQPADGKIILIDSSGMARLYGRDYTPPTKKKYRTVTTARIRAAKGTVRGTGGYAAGTRVTLTAKAKKGYSFAGWKEEGKRLKRKNPYSFVLRTNRKLVALFTKNQKNSE